MANAASYPGSLLAVGVDCSSGTGTLTYACLDRDLRVAALGEIETAQLLDLLTASPLAAVAVNSPSHLNTGLVRKRLQAQKGGSHSLRGVEIREAEQDLHQRGIPVSGTPRAESLCPAWVQMGLRFYQSLEEAGFVAFPAPNAPHLWLETHPHAAFCALLGRQPLSKPTLEGRLQRALALFERGVRLHDPMAFLEEFTRHRLLHGSLPMEQLLSPEQLDALVAAYTAWLAAMRPGECSQVGNDSEGFITLPAATLQDRY